VSVREVSYHLEGYGHTVWEAGVALSGWVKAHRNLFNERNVVELGSGCGLAGLSAAQVKHLVFISLIPSLFPYTYVYIYILLFFSLSLYF
jgi:hypothetical protein